MGLISKNEVKKLQVSSTVKNDKSFRKQNIFDGCEDTCWKSDEGSPQWITVEFNTPQQISNFNIQFQGGFVGQDCRVELSCDNESLAEPFFPEDINSVQKFTLSKQVLCKQIKIVFERSTDFFGRIVIYSIEFH